MAITPAFIQTCLIGDDAETQQLVRLLFGHPVAVDVSQLWRGLSRDGRGFRTRAVRWVRVARMLRQIRHSFGW